MVAACGRVTKYICELRGEHFIAERLLLKQLRSLAGAQETRELATLTLLSLSTKMLFIVQCLRTEFQARHAHEISHKLAKDN